MEKLIDKAKEKLNSGKLLLKLEIVRFNPNWFKDKELLALPTGYEFIVDGVKWIVDYGVNKPEVSRSSLVFEEPKVSKPKPKVKPKTKVEEKVKKVEVVKEEKGE